MGGGVLYDGDRAVKVKATKGEIQSLRKLGRRNITNEQKAYILGKLYEARKNTNGGNRGNQYTKMAKPENLEVPSRKGISQEIADEQGVSHDTVEKAAEFSRGLDKADEVAPGFRKDILDGNVKAPKKAIQSLRKLGGEMRQMSRKLICLASCMRRERTLKVEIEETNTQKRQKTKMNLCQITKTPHISLPKSKA